MNNAIGKFLGYFLGSLPLHEYLPSLFSNQLQAVYTIGAALIVVSASVTLISTRKAAANSSSAGDTEWETIPSDDVIGLAAASPDRSPGVFQTLCLVFVDTGMLLRNMPRPMFTAFVAQFWAYFGLFTLFIYGR